MHSTKYRWPASALTAEDMRLLHAVREARPGTSISELIARAVRREYGRIQTTDPNPQETRKCA
jgi:hypothetical protein